ncbi:MAG: type II toxin-antitoxin system Phd/YefM family antitoxin [Syntrophaceae bacterium]|nr:type II toxin-antitoxin system Phd/YefM family antitoxin [Syntrophaceae bacterium]
MKTIAAQEIKRRGIGAVDEAISHGPVYVIRNNQPKYVILSEKDYESILSDLAEVRLTVSENDLKAGRVKRGSSKKLLAELLKS